MEQSLFLKCFLIGISASSAAGPIFVLTFNNGATRGFLKGFLTAFGAAVGDGILLFLGLAGTLSIFETSRHYHLTIDLIGGALLIIIGISMILSKKEMHIPAAVTSHSVVLAVTKPLLSTLFNPLTLFFFMFISTKILDAQPELASSSLIAAATATGLGTLTALSLVAFAASRIGKMVNHHYLKVVAVITGLIMLGIGFYFFFDAARLYF